MIINTNLASINAQRNLNASSQAMQNSLTKLSSGLRINKAADDAAGLAISQKMQAQINGLNQAQSNAQDGISLLQTAEGGLNETQNILQRMRELAVEGANDTLDSSDRNAISTEMSALSDEIAKIAGQTKFNGKVLLNGGSIATTGLSLQVGANDGETMTVSIGNMSAASLGVTAASVSVAAASTANNTISEIDGAIAKVSTQRAQLGAWQNQLQSTINNLTTSSENITAARSRITDVDMAQEMSNFTKNQVLQQAGVSMLAQANQVPQAVLKLLG